jgi:hypothetical protein
MTAYDVSPRTTAPYHTDAPSCTSTSPTMEAVGAINAPGWMRGTLSPMA